MSNLKMLQYSNEVTRYINKDKPLPIKHDGCEICGGYLVRTDWAPTCNECGSVHTHLQSLKFENDDFKKPQKVLYSQMLHLLGKITKFHAIALDYKTRTRLIYLFDRVLTVFENVKGTRKNFMNYEYILMKIFEYMEKPEISCLFKKLKSKKTIIEHNTLWEKIKVLI